MKKDKNEKNQSLVLSGKQIMEACAAKIVNVPVPGWDASVRCRVPNPGTIYEMRLASANNEVFMKKLFQACLVDLTKEQVDELENSNGLKYYELYNAVISNTDLFTNALKKENVKN
jgi:hypothetical protein